MTYTGWLAVENATTALADASTLLMQPGLRCENGRPAPIAEPDWIRFTDRTLAAARRMHRLTQMRNSEAISEFTLELSASAACDRTAAGRFATLSERRRSCSPACGARKLEAPAQLAVGASYPGQRKTRASSIMTNERLLLLPVV